MEKAIIGFIVSTTAVLIGLFFEKNHLRFVERIEASFFNIKYFAVESLINATFYPAATMLTAKAVSAAGGGLITLPAEGWRALPAVLIYIAAADFGEYVFHRAQHRFQFLWSMHSLHHSDTAINASTTIRHYWADIFIKSVVIYLPLGIIFDVSPIVGAAYSLMSFYNYFVHMDVKIGFGRWSVLLNAPQYHRIHHSALPEYHDCNFAAFFPAFDWIFGSYRRPEIGEFPPTGLDTGETPRNMLAAILWPFRQLIPTERVTAEAAR
jgi:sterol desaturase/sphingolipid hydroxylase (fatty acid hydroxylase superfamily)